MPLKPAMIQPVPEETARVAKATFRRGNPLLSLRDELGAVFADADFADLFPRLGQPGLARLARVPVPRPGEERPSRQITYMLAVPGTPYAVGAGIYAAEEPTLGEQEAAGARR